MGPTLSLPPLANWQDFERLCCDLWKRIWKVQHAHLHGRTGQPQHGVDVFAPLDGGARWAGVQCKRFEETFKSKRQLEDEVAKAKKFNPALCDFVIATTAPNDEKAQQWAREITAEQKKQGSFPVAVYGWGDLCRELAPHQDLIRLYFPDFSWPPDPPPSHAMDGSLAAVRQAYLANLFSQLERLTLGVFGRSSQRVETRLHEVFVSLDIEGLVSLPRTKALAKLGPFDRTPASYSTTADSALVALADHSHLVLTGKAGSGKSTFGRFIALCLAGELLGRGEANLSLLDRDRPNARGVPLTHNHRVWQHGAPLPFFVELSRFVLSEAFPRTGEEGGARHLFEFLAGQGKLRDLLPSALGHENGTLLVLDGLDEVPAAASVRSRLRQSIEGFVWAWPHCRILVTSRPYAYDREGWRLDGFASAQLAPFNEAKRADFVRAWIAHLAVHGEIEPLQVETRCAGLIETIEANPYLRPLADSPLMLTMIADLDATHGGRLPPGGRARLYEESVGLLLDRWNQLRHGANLADLCGLDTVALRRALEKLAFEVHRSSGRDDQWATAISESDLWQAVKGARPPEGRIDEKEIRDYLHQRSGILVAESPEVFRFPHRTYQEFLAACYLSRTRFPSLLIKEVSSNPALWREVFMLVVGRARESPFTAWAALEGLVPEPPEGVLSLADPRFWMALYAALALEETGLWQQVEAQDRPKLERIRQWLQETVRLGALPVVDRAAAGRMLGRLGDRRFGVGLGPNGWPEIDWVEIPPGAFKMGYNKTLVVLEHGFAIARYPITNAQFQAFVDDGGYGESQQDCWTAEGWSWRSENAIKGPDDNLPPALRIANHPRVGVSFFEAWAFSRWLGGKIGLRIVLPTTHQWERSARSVNGRKWPWGNEEDRSRLNNNSSGTTAVGIFPSGASKEGVLDLAGNVWEWTASPRIPRPADSSPEDAEYLAATPAMGRVLRGGSFMSSGYMAKSTFYSRWTPVIRKDDRGFRVALLRPRPRGQRKS